MEHLMHLKPGPFRSIADGTKRYELRLYDGKRRTILPGDTIAFENTDTGESLTAEVTCLKVYRDFRDLYSDIPKTELGYGEDESADPSDMDRYYDPAIRADHCVVAIGISVRRRCGSP